jgi:hypothetical protein
MVGMERRQLCWQRGEKENARLKRLLAEAELDKAMLKDLAEGNF